MISTTLYKSNCKYKIMKNRILALIIGIVLFASCTKVETGYDVLNLMKSKYENNHIENMTFSQHVKEYSNDSITHKTIWHEAYAAPGNLIIKIDSFTGGSGYVFNGDTLFILNDNKIDLKVKELNILMILGFDVYSVPIKNTISKLNELEYDLNLMCETKLDNKDVYCIGVSNESDEQNKFYIDKENLYFIKYISYSENGISEIKFADYEVMNGYNVAKTVLFYFNNELYMTEEYYDIEFPKIMDPEIFNALKFKEAIW